MKNNILEKTFAIGIIFLFIGAGVVTANNTNIEKKNDIELVVKSGSDVKQFHPIDDAKIAQDDPSKNYGSDPGVNIRNEFGIGRSSGWGSDGLFKFDISSIPKGASVIRATFYLFYNKWTSTNPAGRMLNVYILLNDWNENTVTWNTAPTYNQVASAYSPVPATVNVWIEWNVTSDVVGFLSGTSNYGWRVRDDNYWGMFDIPLTQVRTKEAGQEISPYLEIEYIKTRSNEVTNHLILRFLARFPMLEILLRLIRDD